MGKMKKKNIGHKKLLSSSMSPYCLHLNLRIARKGAAEGRPDYIKNTVSAQQQQQKNILPYRLDDGPTTD
jgi:hypothetical protein